MLYQGEDIAITVTFDEEVLSQASSFTLLVYPSFNVNHAGYKSSDVVASDIENLTYTFTIPYSKTKDMPTGSYTIEVLMKVGQGDDETRSIFQQTDAFTLKYAKAKDEEVK
jgi:hypothetical protein